VCVYVCVCVCVSVCVCVCVCVSRHMWNTWLGHNKITDVHSQSDILGCSDSGEDEC
jgi:hypothetical protein